MNTAVQEQKLTPEIMSADQLTLCEQEIETLEVECQKIKAFLTQVQEETKNHLRGVVNTLNNKGENLERIRSALLAGYGEVTLPKHQDWETGFPKHEDPRPYKWANWLWPIGGTMLLLLIASSVLVFVTSGVVLKIGFGTFSGTAIALLGTFILGAILNERNLNALVKAGFPRYRTTHFLREALPVEVAEKHQRAKESGLFDKIPVYAPLTAFYRAGKVDPIMYGTIGDRTFLIAQWNLGEDLKHSES